jgi:hypothetical protein
MWDSLLIGSWLGAPYGLSWCVRADVRDSRLLGSELGRALCVEGATLVKLGPVLRFDGACDAFLRVPVFLAGGGFRGGV